MTYETLARGAPSVIAPAEEIGFFEKWLSV
jgi:hypothetical protein